MPKKCASSNRRITVCNPARILCRILQNTGLYRIFYQDITLTEALIISTLRGGGGGGGGGTLNKKYSIFGSKN